MRHVKVAVRVMVGVLGASGGWGLSGCSGSAGSPKNDVSGRSSAVFTNGDFESDSIGSAPSGWAVNTYLNTGITDTRPSPQTIASLNLGAGGYAATQAVGGPAESQADPDLGSSVSLKYPKYGVRAAVVNYKDASNKGNNHNVNMLSQTMTTTNADVDPTDDKVHVRFAIAPVLQSGGHSYTQQPYYFVELDNVTKGTVLYNDFNSAAQSGVPWKVGGSGGDVYYTDWQLVDIAPGNAGLAVGDQVKLVVIAGGCYATAHFGRVYVDGIGSSIPGISASATGPSSVNAGSDITYVVNYKNGGTATAASSEIDMVIPTSTTYKSNSLPSACVTGTVSGSSGLICSLGSLAPGASGSFTVTVTVAAGTASGTVITNGNYSIVASGVSALLGPKVLTSVTTGVTYADLSVTKSDGLAAVGWGQAVSYAVTVSNAGPGAASSVSVSDMMPAQLTGVTWTCAGTGGGTCTASGSGSLSTTASLPVGASVTYTIAGTVVPGSGTGSVVNTVTATAVGGVSDPDTSNNTAVDTDAIGTLRTLSLTKTNPSGGSVTSVPAALSCGTSCTSATAGYVDGTAVVLTASPVSGASFTGWGGACAGTSPTCTVTMSGDKSVTAAFTPPPSINIVSGNNQGAALNGSFVPLKVQALDSSSNPIVGGTVIFTVPASGASATIVGGASATTDASGYATVNVTANGTAGAYSIVAGLSGTPLTATFSVWNYGAANSIAVVSGSGQSAAVNASFTTLTAIVRDAANQPVPNVNVAFAAPGSGARATLTAPTTVATSAAGQASVAATAGTTAGTYTVTATAANVATPASFTLTNTAGGPASITASGGGGQSTAISTVFASPLVVTVADVFGNPIAGATVNFTAPATGASGMFSPASGTTSAAGQLSTMVTANGVAGAYNVTASVPGLAATASFALSNYGPLALLPVTATVTPLGSRTFMASGDPAGSYTFAVSTNNSGGAITAGGVYTAGPVGNVTDVVRVTDSLSRTATATVTVSAQLAINPGAPTIPPRGAQTFTTTGGSGTGVTFTLSTNNSGGSINATTGAYVAGPTGGVTDTVTATDSQGNTATATITVGAGISLSPSAPATAPRGTVNFTASGGSGSGYSFAVTTNRSNATVDSTGKYVAGSTGSVTDTVTVTDGLGNSASAVVTVGPPLSLMGSASLVAPRGAVTFTAANGSGTGYVYAISMNASGASINAATGAYTAGATPSVTDVVSVTDSLGNVATANVSVGLGVSISPALPAAPPRGTVSLTASGGSGSGFQYTLTSNLSGGSVDPGTGLYTAGATGGVTDIVMVTDALGNTAQVSISVGGGMAISPAAPSLAPRQPQSFTTSGGSGAGVNYAVSTNNSGASIVAATGAYTAGPTPNTVDVVTATDSLGNTASATVHVGAGVTVTPASTSLAPLGQQTFSVSGGSGTGYTFVLSTNASNGGVNVATGAYRAGTTGGVGDVVTVQDSLGNSATAAIAVTAALEPVAGMGTLQLAPKASQSLAVTGGAGGNAFALNHNGSGATLDPVTGAYTAGAQGDSSDLVIVTDQNGATTTILINVGPGVSLAPAAPRVPPQGPVTFTATGGAGTGYTFAIVTNGSGGTLDPVTGAYMAGTVANAVDTIQVTDALGNTATANVTVGNGLLISPATPTVAPRATLTFTADGGSGAGYTFALGANLSGATIDPTTGVYQAGPTPSVADQVTVTDSLGNTSTTVVTVGPGLLVTPAASSVSPRAEVILNASGGSGRGYNFVLTTNASNGTVQSDSGRYVAGTTGSVTDVVTVTDSLGNSATATIQVGAGITLSAASATVPPRGSTTLTATGGSGSYVFTVRFNGSGASVSPTSGAYTAGPIPFTSDLVEVTDALGNTADVYVATGPGVSLKPPMPAVPPAGSQMFTPQGGSGMGYTFALTVNGSGGTVVPTSGLYTAGARGDAFDVITVTDSLGNTFSLGISVGNGVGVNPQDMHVAPRATVQLTAIGGSGTGYAFSLVANGSGATVDAATGLYVAGPTPNTTDRVSVTDSLGKTATSLITVGPGVSITPAMMMIAPLGPISFTVAGGSSTGYVFAFAGNGSGATLDPGLGKYQAGPTGSTADTVAVVDSLGNGAQADIQVGAALSLSPSSAMLPPRGPQVFVASGGSPAYAFGISMNGSGASINPSTGEYLAGATANAHDTVTVRDGNGAMRSIAVTVGPGVTIAPASPTVGAGKTIHLTASGGSNMGFTWRLVQAASGGSVVAASGDYTAARVPVAGASDVVEVSDSLGNTARVTISPQAVTVSPVGGGGCAVGGRPTTALSVATLAVLAMLAGRRRRARP